MYFSSLLFLFVFLPIVLAVYYIVPRKFRNAFLLLANLVFYGWGEPVFILIMIVSVVSNYIFGLLIEKYRDNQKRKKTFLVLSLVISLGLLAVFKYTGFVTDILRAIPPFSFMPKINLPLPIGISFYTFQTLSYTIDVYRGDTKAQKSLVSFGTYVSFFPQLIAGPIVRYQDIENQLNGRTPDADDFREGIPMFVKGFFKKVVLANVIGSLHTQILAMGMSNISAMTAWLGALAYTLQIFNDFSGYSDMAIGLGRMLGFEFPKNFDRPYASGSVTEFWRRWHISLGTWFREYVYIPLGGNRKGVKRQIINLLIVWALTGLWHGAAWNFVIWGLYYGILLIFEKFVYVHLQKRLPKFLNVVITFIVVIIGWVFFFSNNMTEAVSYLKAMFGQSGCSHDGMGGFLLLNNLVMIILAWIPSVFDFKEGKKKSPLKWVLCIMVFLITIAFLVSESYNPFLYFRF